MVEANVPTLENELADLRREIFKQSLQSQNADVEFIEECFTRGDIWLTVDQAISNDNDDAEKLANYIVHRSS